LAPAEVELATRFTTPGGEDCFAIDAAAVQTGLVLCQP
jgi:hypothetical protein